MQNAINKLVSDLIVGGCVSMQSQVFISADMFELTDKVITELGYGPEDWDALDEQLYYGHYLGTA